MKKIFNVIIIVSLVLIGVSCEKNEAPTVVLQFGRFAAFPEEEIMVAALAVDEDINSLKYAWNVSSGDFTLGAYSNIIMWAMPEEPGFHEVSLTVSDGKHDVAVYEKLEVLESQYYDSYAKSIENMGTYNLDYRFEGGDVILEVEDKGLEDYGTLATILGTKSIVFNKAFINCAYNMKEDNGKVKFEFDFLLDDTYVGKQLGAIYIEIDPLSEAYNWAVQYEWKDLSTGESEIVLFDDKASGKTSLISAGYNQYYHDINLIRKEDNTFEFYYDENLIYSTTAIKDLIASEKIEFDYTLDKTLFHVYDNASMSLEYFCLYK